MANTSFGGSIPLYYDRCLGPVIFEPYAREIVKRVEGPRILEIAAGTGRVTRHLVAQLAPEDQLTATDINPEMLALAQSKIDDSRVVWQLADATELPFSDDAFDSIICQFGVMFYPDKDQAHREARRVLREGGRYVFSAWGQHEQNPWSRTVHLKMRELFPEETPGFMAIPFTYNDEAMIRESLHQAGFREVHFETLTLPLIAEDAVEFARGAIAGNPLSLALYEKGVSDLEPFIEAVAREFRANYGDKPMKSEMTALIVTAS